MELEVIPRLVIGGLVKIVVVLEKIFLSALSARVPPL
jgi:hypothetical protein